MYWLQNELIVYCIPGLRAKQYVIFIRDTGLLHSSMFTKLPTVPSDWETDSLLCSEYWE